MKGNEYIISISENQRQICNIINEFVQEAIDNKGFCIL